MVAIETQESGQLSQEEFWTTAKDLASCNTGNYIKEDYGYLLSMVHLLVLCSAEALKILYLFMFPNKSWTKIHMDSPKTVSELKVFLHSSLKSLQLATVERSIISFNMFNCALFNISRVRNGTILGKCTNVNSFKHSLNLSS